MATDRTSRDHKAKETGAAALRRRVEELTALLEERSERLADAEATLSAIRSGEADALVVSTRAGDAVYTLRGADHAYRIFLEDMGDGAVTLTREGLILYANRRFAEIVGTPLQQVIGSPIYRFLSPSCSKWLRDSLVTAMKRGRRGEASFEKQGGKVPALLSLTALPDSDPPALCMVVTDLTERERAHQELIDAHRAVAESEQRFRNLVNSSLVGFFIVTDGWIVFANAEQQRIFGRFPIPARLKDLISVFPRDRDRFASLCDVEFVTRSGVSETDVRFYLESRAGSTVRPLWAHCRAAPIEFQGKNSVLVNMVDVTHAREMERLATVQDKMASLGQLTAGIAHNIRNPLSGINIYIDSMKSLLEDAAVLDLETKESVSKHIETLLQASGKIENVIRQVLDFSKPPPTDEVLVPVDIAIRAAVELCSMSLRKNQIAIEMDILEGIPPSYAGEGILEQVFLNVINNAAQVLENYPGNRRIAISADFTDGFAVVRIADSGPGVPEKIREKIFEMFFTTRQQGTGIGLAFSRRVLESVGGHIDVGESDLGGAEFRIQIPVGDKRNPPRRGGSGG